MMPLYRFRLRLDAAAPFGTPPTSGTIFGHLCWAIRTREGRAVLVDFLARLPGDPTIVSDLLPADHVPRPLLPAHAAAGADEDTAKPLKRRRFIPLTLWKELRIGAHETALRRRLVVEQNGRREVSPDPPFLAIGRLPHNRIDRRSGKTPEAGGGGLWFADEHWPQASEGQSVVNADLYVKTPLPVEMIRDWLADIGLRGFGRDATYGRGAFSVAGHEKMDWLTDAPHGHGTPRMMSLSQGVITPNMTRVRWQRFVLFGKVGREMMAEGLRPWKRPVVLARAGATFDADNAGPFGAWLTDVHQDRADIGHNAFHLAIPYTEAA
jgi:CRISPR-associated protein Csm4